MFLNSHILQTHTLINQLSTCSIEIKKKCVGHSVQTIVGEKKKIFFIEGRERGVNKCCEKRASRRGATGALLSFEEMQSKKGARFR